jgi:predicted DCC family thiol-disulfide oxidoreductase YuxK
VSINYEKKFKPLGIPREHFEQLIYEGEKAWAEGLDFPMLVFSPLNHGLDVKEISRTILQTVSKRASAKMSLESDYTRKLQLISQAQEVNDLSQLSNLIVAIITDTKYVKARRIVNKPCCNLAYEAFLENKYNISTAKIKCFYNKEVASQQLVLDGEKVERSTSYIPYPVLQQAKIFYDEQLASTNIKTDSIYQLKATMAVLDHYYRDTIDAIPDNLFPQSPADYDSKLYQIASTMAKLEQGQQEPFEVILKDPSQYLHILNLFYKYDKGYFQGCKQPVSFDATLEHSTYMKIVLVDADGERYNLEAERPTFQTTQIKGVKLKQSQAREVGPRFEKLISKMQPEKKEETIKQILAGQHPIVELPNFNTKLNIPEIDLQPKLVTITDTKMYFVTYDRLYRQFGDIKYYHAMQRCETLKNIMLSTPYRNAKIA